MIDFKNKPYRTSQKKNGHKQAKKRELFNKEIEYIKGAFKKANGQLHYGFCSKIRDKLDPDITVFQVSGVCRYFHAQVKSGKMTLRDVKSYKKFIEAHRRKWKTYKSEKYQPLIKYRKFFEFYQDHRKDIDRMIWHVARSYQTHYDPCEMFSQILFRLLESNVINDYNKDRKLKFKNYVYNRIAGYGTHIYDEYLRRKGSKKKSLLENGHQKKVRIDKSFISYEKAFEDHILNEDTIIPSNFYPSPQDAISFKEILTYAKSNLRERDYKVFVLKAKGFRNNEIARRIRKSNQAVKDALQRISEKLEIFKGY